MKKVSSLFLFLILFILSGRSQDQNAWTLESCLEYARVNNLALKRQELLSRISKNNYFQAYMNLAPDINAFGRHNLSSGKTVNLEDYTYINTTFYDGYAGIQTNALLFNGLQNWNRILQNRYDFQASILDVEKSANDLSLNITAAFLQVLLDKELLKVAENQLQVTELQVEKSKKMVELGSMAKGELLEIRAQAATERSQVTASRNRLRMSLLTLAQLMDLESSDGFDISVPEDISVEDMLVAQPAENIINNALLSFPEIKGAEYRLMSSKKSLAMARGERSPSVNFIGTLYSRYSELAVDPLDPASTYAIGSQLDDNFYKQISLSINIPIFNRWTIQNNISNARIMMEDAALELEEERINLSKQVEQAYTDAMGALENYRSALEDVASNQEAFTSSEQRYNLGSASTVDYNIAKKNLLNAEANLIQAKYTFVLYSKILDFYNGNPIEF